MNPIEALQQKRAEKATQMNSLVAAVQAEGRAMDEKEIAKFNELDGEVKQLEASIAAFERNEQVASKPNPRVVPPPGSEQTTTTPVPQPGRAGITGDVVAHRFSNHGFEKGVGEFLMKVRDCAVTNKIDPRLMVNAVTTWAGESVGADGGWALPPEFVRGIMSLVAPPNSFLGELNPFPTQSDVITVPKDEDAPWSTSAVTAAKTAEGTAITASKISVSQLKVVMYGVKSLVHVDEKSLRDMAFLGAYVERKMGEKIRWKVENYVLNGTGMDEPLGMINSPGKQSIADNAGTSTTTTLTADDVGLMEATSLVGPGGFWVFHPLVKNKVRFLVMNSTVAYPLYVTDMRNGAPVDTLLGYPAYASEACKAWNTEGDILFVKQSGYILAFEQGGVMNATTIAFAFDQNLQSFRSTLYMGGAPTLSSPVLRADGSNYASNIVTLAART